MNKDYKRVKYKAFKRRNLDSTVTDNLSSACVSVPYDSLQGGLLIRKPHGVSHLSSFIRSFSTDIKPTVTRTKRKVRAVIHFRREIRADSNGEVGWVRSCYGCLSINIPLDPFC